MPSTPQFKLKEITQVGFVVKDAEKTAKALDLMFGIGPWAFRYIEGTDLKGRYKDVFHKERIAQTRLGNIIFELVEPVEGKAVHAEFLDKFGEGIQHIQVCTDDIDGNAEKLVAQGAEYVLKSVRGTAYMGNLPGGLVLEIVWNMTPPVFTGELSKPDASKQVKLKEIGQIGYVVKDVEKVSKAWTELFGLGPWRFFEIEGTDAGGKYKGIYHKEKLASTKLADLNIEIIQPVIGKAVHGTFLEEHGEGIQHVFHRFDDLEKEIAKLTDQGGECVLYFPGHVAYMGNLPGGLVLEMVQTGAGAPIAKK